MSILFLVCVLSVCVFVYHFLVKKTSPPYTSPKLKESFLHYLSLPSPSGLDAVQSCPLFLQSFLFPHWWRMLSAPRMPTLWELHSSMSKQHILLGHCEQLRFNLHFKTACALIVLTLRIMHFMYSCLAKWHSVMTVFVDICNMTTSLSKLFWLSTLVWRWKHLFACRIV